MQLTIEQAVEAHKAGRLEEAEALYRAILKDQPKHPDASHNLGLLVGSLNNSAAALPLLRTAIEANPKQAQYWVSYIDALIKDNQSETARLVLEKGMEMGLSGEKIDALGRQLTPRSDEPESDKVQSPTFTQQRKKFSAKKEKKKNAHSPQRSAGHAAGPSQYEVNALLAQYQSGQYAAAEKLAVAMTQKYPNHQLGWKALGAVFRTSGRLPDAVVACQKAVALVPNDVEAHSNLGTTLQDLGRLEEAEASYRQAITLKPDLAEAQYNLGNTLNDLGRLEEAEASYRQAITLKPDYAEAQYNLGNTLRDLGRLEEAEASFRHAITLKPDLAEAHSDLGNTLKDLGRLEDAEASYRQAITLKPVYAEAHYNLGITLRDLGRLEEAEASYSHAIALKPDFEAAYCNLGVTLQDLGRLEEAEASFRHAITLKPDLAEAHSDLGKTLQDLDRLEEAEVSYRHAITLKPDYAAAHYNLGVTLTDLGQLEDAEASYRHAITLKPDLAEAHSNLVFMLMSAGRVNSSVKDAHQHCANDRVIALHKFERWDCEKQPRRLRVGFVSGDFSNHPVGYFLESVLDKLDQSKVELFAYTTKNKTDSLTDRIKPYFSFWKTVVGISDQKAASTIQNDGVHVLIDLSGHTRGNRLSVFAYRPAPVQVTWLGYFGTTGITEIDYILGDPNVTPIKESNHFTEKIWQLPESYLCFTPPEFDLEVNPLPAKSTGVITFGCFNNHSKITDQVIAVWAKILHAVPHSQLFLKGKTLSAPTQRVQFEASFARHGITSNRLILEGGSTRSDLLACYRRVDVALDPFPYPGGTTSVESLWMGVPVLTLRGTHFLSHVGETIAINAGLPDWIAFDTEDYVVRAVALASDYEKLAKLRMGLRQQVLASPLFDSTRFARNFEAAIWAMWQKSNESNITS
jgi:protein O-GlcNAc transferase